VEEEEVANALLSIERAFFLVKIKIEKINF